MAGEAEVKLKFIADEKALATAEKKIESMTNRLDQMEKAGKRAAQVKIDPIASKMSSGSTGTSSMIAGLNAHTSGIRQAAAAESEYKATLLQRLSAMRESDAARASFSRQAQVRAVTGADRLAHAPAIMQTRNIIGQVRAQQAAREAAKLAADELAKQPGLIESAGGAALRYLGPLALAATAVKLIGNEWNNVIERQQKAGQVAITFEEALGEATLNVGAVMSPDKLKARALKMSAETGVAPATAVQAMSLAIKSGGATNEEEANRLADAAVVAGKLSPRAGAEKLADTSGSIASYMARTGATAEQAGGVLLSMQSKSNIADPNKAMAAAGPTLANMLAQGASEGMAQAMMPALSQAIEDTQGDMSSLAATQFTQSLAEAGATRFKGQKNIPDKMLAAMRADPKLAADFFSGDIETESGKKLGKPELGRGKAETFFRAISGDATLEGDQGIIGSYRRQFDEFSAQAIDAQQAGKFYNERLDQVRGATPTVQADRILKSTAEQNRLSGVDAMRGVSREGMKDVLQSAGESDLANRFATGNFDFSNQEALGQTAATLREKAFSIRQEESVFEGLSRIFSDGGMGNVTRSEARDPVAEETAKRLDRAAAALEKIAERNAQRPFDRKGNVENVENN